MAVTPAGAEVSSAVGTNWKKIWKKNLKPLADRRYYTKAQSDTKYASKAEDAASAAAAQAGATSAANAATDSKLGNYYKKIETYSKAEADAKYAAAGSGYTKVESDVRYQRSTELIRGNTMIVFTATAAGQVGGSEISLGSTFSAAPAMHIIAPGGVAPAGCSGNAAAPNADPGHLCIFGSLLSNAGAPNTCKVSTASCFTSATDPWGASIFVNASAVGTAQYFATWAARPAAVTSTAIGRTAPSGNPLSSGSGVG